MIKEKEGFALSVRKLRDNREETRYHRGRWYGESTVHSSSVWKYYIFRSSSVCYSVLIMRIRQKLYCACAQGGIELNSGEQFDGRKRCTRRGVRRGCETFSHRYALIHHHATMCPYSICRGITTSVMEALRGTGNEV